jgi:hypothetical protein
MTDDNLPEGFFSHLSPADFDRDTSARHVAVLEQVPFNHFVEASLESLRFAYHAADGNPNPVAIMVCPDGRRMFTPDDDETLGQYIDRLGREARQHGAIRLFTAWLTEGGTYEGSEHTVDSPEAMAAAEASGAMRPVLYWFAQDGLRNPVIRHGIMAIDSGNTGSVHEAAGEHAAPVYRSILGG